MKRSTRILFSAAAVLGLATVTGSAGAELSPTPIYTIIPTFNCGVTVSGSTGTATITKSNAAAIDQTKDIIAIVQTPSGKVIAETCGKAFTSDATGTSVKAPFNVPPTKDKSWIYTCVAHQATTTFACNPPK